jgi:hypothetical protein
MKFDSYSKLTGGSKLESDWSSPMTRTIGLTGNAILNDLNVIGIKIVAL